MQLDAVLCNHAEAVNNLLYLSGGGINTANAAQGVPPPYLVTVGVGLLVTVPWGQTNQQHRVEIGLTGEDGEAVSVPTGPTTVEPMSVVLAFNVGRPASLTAGDDQMIALAANLSLPLPSLGKYEFVVTLDGHEERRLPLRVAQPPGAQITFGPVGG